MKYPFYSVQNSSALIVIFMIYNKNSFQLITIHLQTVQNNNGTEKCLMIIS